VVVLVPGPAPVRVDEITTYDWPANIETPCASLQAHALNCDGVPDGLLHAVVRPVLKLYVLADEAVYDTTNV
jgi:hypothetical protein